MDQRVEESIEDIRALLVWCVKNVNNKWNFHEYDHAARALGKLGALFSALEAERDALREDAERWRWARDKWQIQEAIDSIVGDDTVTINAMEVRIDAHIASIAAKEPK